VGIHGVAATYPQDTGDVTAICPCTSIAYSGHVAQRFCDVFFISTRSDTMPPDITPVQFLLVIGYALGTMVLLGGAYALGRRSAK
jgi:hypothetical protein